MIIGFDLFFMGRGFIMMPDVVYLVYVYDENKMLVPNIMVFRSFKVAEDCIREWLPEGRSAKIVETAVSE